MQVGLRVHKTKQLRKIFLISSTQISFDKTYSLKSTTGDDECVLLAKDKAQLEETKCDADLYPLCSVDCGGL